MCAYKGRYSLLFKALIIALVCLFCVNDISWALAPHIQLTEVEFKERFKAVEFLLGHNAANAYLKEQIGIDKSVLGKAWDIQRIKKLDIKDPSIRGNIDYSVDGLDSVVLVSVTGLLANTGQFAHVGLSGKDYDGVTVIYIDSQFFNDKSNTIQKHDIDEILQWENLRNILHKKEKSEMRSWIIEHCSLPDEKLKGTVYEGLTSRQIAKKFHERSYYIDSIYKSHVDKIDFSYEYINLMLSLYGGDEESKDVNIAAKKPPTSEPSLDMNNVTASRKEVLEYLENNQEFSILDTVSSYFGTMANPQYNYRFGSFRFDTGYLNQVQALGRELKQKELFEDLEKFVENMLGKPDGSTRIRIYSVTHPGDSLGLGLRESILSGDPIKISEIKDGSFNIYISKEIFEYVTQKNGQDDIPDIDLYLIFELIWQDILREYFRSNSASINKIKKLIEKEAKEEEKFQKNLSLYERSVLNAMIVADDNPDWSYICALARLLSQTQYHTWAPYAGWREVGRVFFREKLDEKNIHERKKLSSGQFLPASLPTTAIVKSDLNLDSLILAARNAQAEQALLVKDEKKGVWLFREPNSAIDRPDTSDEERTLDNILIRYFTNLKVLVDRSSGFEREYKYLLHLPKEIGKALAFLQIASFPPVGAEFSSSFGHHPEAGSFSVHVFSPPTSFNFKPRSPRGNDTIEVMVTFMDDPHKTTDKIIRIPADTSLDETIRIIVTSLPLLPKAEFCKVIVGFSKMANFLSELKEDQQGAVLEKFNQYIKYHTEQGAFNEALPWSGDVGFVALVAELKFLMQDPRRQEKATKALEKSYEVFTGKKTNKIEARKWVANLLSLQGPQQSPNIENIIRGKYPNALKKHIELTAINAKNLNVAKPAKILELYEKILRQGGFVMIGNSSGEDKPISAIEEKLSDFYADILRNYYVSEEIASYQSNPFFWVYMQKMTSYAGELAYLPSYAANCSSVFNKLLKDVSKVDTIEGDPGYYEKKIRKLILKNMAMHQKLREEAIKIAKGSNLPPNEKVGCIIAVLEGIGESDIKISEKLIGNLFSILSKSKVEVGYLYQELEGLIKCPKLIPYIIDKVIKSKFKGREEVLSEIVEQLAKDGKPEAAFPIIKKISGQGHFPAFFDVLIELAKKDECRDYIIGFVDGIPVDNQDDREMKLKVLTKIGDIYWDIGDKDTAKDLYKNAFDLTDHKWVFPTIGDTHFYPEILWIEYFLPVMRKTFISFDDWDRGELLDWVKENWVYKVDSFHCSWSVLVAIIFQEHLKAGEYEKGMAFLGEVRKKIARDMKIDILPDDSRLSPQSKKLLDNRSTDYLERSLGGAGAIIVENGDLEEINKFEELVRKYIPERKKWFYRAMAEAFLQKGDFQQAMRYAANDAESRRSQKDFDNLVKQDGREVFTASSETILDVLEKALRKGDINNIEFKSWVKANLLKCAQYGWDSSDLEKIAKMLKMYPDLLTDEEFLELVSVIHANITRNLVSEWTNRGRLLQSFLALIRQRYPIIISNLKVAAKISDIATVVVVANKKSPSESDQGKVTKVLPDPKTTLVLEAGSTKETKIAKTAKADKPSTPAVNYYIKLPRTADKAYIDKLAERYGETREIKNALAGARLGMVTAEELAKILRIDIGLASAAILQAQEPLMMASPEDVETKEIENVPKTSGTVDKNTTPEELKTVLTEKGISAAVTTPIVAEYLKTQSPDIENALYMMNELLPTNLEAGRFYEIRYDSSRLREYQRRAGIEEDTSPAALLKTYIQYLQMRVRSGNPKDVIKLVESPSKDGKEQNLISVTCYSDKSKTKLIGESGVNIKGDLGGQTLRIIGMLNMALAAVNIPSNLSPDELSGYDKLISFIKDQYRELAWKELSSENILQAIRLIELPSITPIPANELEEYYRLTIQQLQQAA